MLRLKRASMHQAGCLSTPGHRCAGTAGAPRVINGAPLPPSAHGGEQQENESWDVAEGPPGHTWAQPCNTAGGVGVERGGGDTGQKSGSWVGAWRTHPCSL